METVRQIPSEIDWGDYESDEDAAYSHKKFFGKSLDDVVPYFEHGVIEACDELRFMPVVPFRYYIHAFKNHVVSAKLLESCSRADAASCFLELIIEKLTDSPESIIPVVDELMTALEFVANNQALFDADEEIYGNFTGKLAQIKKQVRGP